MEARPFAGLNTRPSPWGYNWKTENDAPSTEYRGSPTNSSSHGSPATNTSTSSPEPQILANQYVNMPAALLTSLKKDKKPFTYTPGGVNLSEVLNARLQKRMERKKKYSEQRMDSEMPKFESPKQVIVMPTYNSPLDMYSMENAIEALEVQAELVAADKSLSAPSRSATLPRNHTFKFDDTEPNKGVVQSKAFKVLQIITDTEQEGHVKGKSEFQDEMRFTGIRDSKTIPSKFFQTLQKITGTEDDQENLSSPPNNKTEMINCKPTHASSQPVQHAMRPGSQTQQETPPMQKTPQTFQNSHPGLKRPAAFLPMKSGGDPLCRIKPVHPPFLTNSPRKVYNQLGGTDF